MSYINQLTLTSLSLNSEAYGATSNGTITTDTAGDINLNPVSGTVNLSGSSAQTIAAPNNLTIESGSSSTPASLYLNAQNTSMTAVGFATIQGNTISLNGNTTVGSSSSSNLTVTGSTTLASASVTGSTTLASVSVTGSTTLASASVTGSTTLGTNSTAISNIQFGNSTFSSVAVASAGDTNYVSGSTINLPFTPTAITLGVSTTNSVIPYMPAVAYEEVGIPSTAPSGTDYSFQLYLYLPEGNNDNSSDYYVSWIAIA